jgi:hypothetical protein
MDKGILQFWRAPWIPGYYSQPTARFSPRGQRGKTRSTLWCMVFCLVSNCKRMKGWWRRWKFIRFACSGIGPWHVTREFTQLLHTAKVTKCHCKYFRINGIETLRFLKIIVAHGDRHYTWRLGTHIQEKKYWMFTYRFINYDADVNVWNKIKRQVRIQIATLTLD